MYIVCNKHSEYNLYVSITECTVYTVYNKHSEGIVIFLEELLQDTFLHLPSLEKKVQKDFTDSFFSSFR